MLYNDLTFSCEKITTSLEMKNGINQLLPYFIQFIYAQLTLNLQEITLVNILISVASALIHNKHFSTELYVHSLINIGLSVVLAIDFGSENCQRIKTISVRKNAAKYLYEIVYKYSIFYPNIGDAIYNSLVNSLFSPYSTFGSQFGALYTISLLGKKYINQIKPSLFFFKKLITPKLNSTLPAIARNANVLYEVIDEMLELSE